MSVASGRSYAFGDFRLYPEEALLLRSGKPVPLTPKTFKLLCVLVEYQGHLVAKDAIMHAVWPDSFVEESNLTYNISVLRKTLSQNGGDLEYIETVPRMGYRFLAPVMEQPATGNGSLVGPPNSPQVIVVGEKAEHERSETQKTVASAPHGYLAAIPARSNARRRALVYVSLAALAIVCLVALVWRDTHPAPNVPQTLAVLPFQNLKPSPESDFLSYSLADAIINRLGYVSGLVVRPSAYVAKYHDSAADPHSVARELHVQSVLTGTYMREADQLLISAELIDVTRSEVLWRESFSLPYDQLVTVQDRVADNVIRGLRIRVLPREETLLSRSVPRNALAYEYYLRAADFGSKNNYRLSIEMLEKAVALEPNFASAYALLGGHYAAYGAFQGGGDEYIAKSKAAYEKALELLPDQPLLHSLMATQMMESGDVDGAVSALRMELRNDPNEPLTHWLLNQAYRYAGMLPESIVEGERALQLDPLVNVGSSFNSYLYSGEYQKFLKTLRSEESARTTFYHGLCYFYMRDYSRAAAAFDHAYRLDPSLLHAKYGQALLFAIHKQNAQGLDYLRQVEANNPTRDGEMLYKVAQIYAVLGDKNSAWRALRQAMDHNFYCDSCFVRDPLLTSLHGERAYNELMGIARQRQDAFREKYF